MKTNSLIYTTERTAPNGGQWNISIELSDECRNGHQDFSITGKCYEKDKIKTERNKIICGACGDEIAAIWPEFEIFNRLHNCDYQGIPTYAIENGFYHLKNGFNSKSTGEDFVNEFCAYYRITDEQYNVISRAESQTHYAILLVECGVLEQWKSEADKAIKLLEELTGDEFLVDSTKSHLNMSKNEDIEAEKEKIANGYYSNEQKAKRETEKRKQELDKIDEEEQKAIDKIKLEYKIKRLILGASKKAFENYIYYSHSNEIKFNWRGSGEIMTDNEIEEVKNKINHLLPNNVTFRK